MRSRFSVPIMLAAIACVSAPVVGARLAYVLGWGASPVGPLDRCIQERFHTLTEFGMGRMPVVPQHIYRFDPTTADEKAAVAELQRQGWRVGLYLGGRGLVKPSMSKAEWKETGEHSARRAISKPMLIAGANTLAGMPEPWELWEIGQKALAASSTSNRFVTSFGRWSVDARPVRANQKACLKCHSEDGATGYPPLAADKKTLRLGDAIGVLVYVYTHSEQ
jgi:hypothetical protein